MDRMVRASDREAEKINDDVQYAAIEEVLAAFRETLPQYDRAYRELARGVGAPPLTDDDLGTPGHVG